MPRRHALLFGIALLAATQLVAQSAPSGPVDPAMYETAIANLKLRIMQYRGVIARQRRAAAISGVVDKQALYASGMVITQSEDQIQQQYARYRAAGGRKPLAKIVASAGLPTKGSRFDY